MEVLELLKAALFGLVEGVTEWLPISSTGHMLLLDQFVSLDVSQDFFDMFMVVIQLGAILAVCVLFFHQLNPFSPKKTPAEKRGTWRLWGQVVLACIPAAAIGIPLVVNTAVGIEDRIKGTALAVLYQFDNIICHTVFGFGIEPPAVQTRAALYRYSTLICRLELSVFTVGIIFLCELIDILLDL